MTLKDIQKQVDELGELSREINNRYGPRIKKSKEDTAEIGEEITDVIFAMICMANSHNIDLDKAWEKKMNKCYGRDKDRWEKKNLESPVKNFIPHSLAKTYPKQSA